MATIKAQTIAPSPFKRYPLSEYDAVIFWDGKRRHLVNEPRALFISADGGRMTVQSFDSTQTVSSTHDEATLEAVIGAGNSRANYFGVFLS